MYIRAYNAKEIGYNKTRGNYGKKSKWKIKNLKKW
jgi:hypothetical protein